MRRIPKLFLRTGDFGLITGSTIGSGFAQCQAGTAIPHMVTTTGCRHENSAMVVSLVPLFPASLFPGLTNSLVFQALFSVQ